MANDLCIELLKDGVYAKHNIVKTQDSNSDYKHYFASDEFRSDFLNKKYNLGVEVVIYGVPLKLDYGSDETEVREFQKKVRESTEFSLTDKFFLNVADSFADKNLLDAFNACMGPGLGFDITPIPSGETITFKVVYTNYGGLPSPLLEDVYISTGGKLLYQTLKTGEPLENNAEATFTFELDSNKKELLFVIDTNISAQSKKVILSKKSKEDGNPIGTVISSFLNWEQFQKTTDNNKESEGIWKSEFSFWCPCDGREVPNSEFQKISSLTKVPDLRGVFLRGLNTFDIAETSNVPALQADPEPNRKRGDFQNHDVQSHIHSFTASISVAQIRGDGGWAAESPTAGKTDPFGGSETRPKNIAIYYYIKIN